MVYMRRIKWQIISFIKKLNKEINITSETAKSNINQKLKLIVSDRASLKILTTPLSKNSLKITWKTK